jgi:hypothetical protein
MSVFISWSGQTSKAVAEALRDWLPKVIQAVEPWMSAEDIEKGARWSHEMTAQLATASFGIVCVTPDNTEAPWLLFEGGALSRVLQNKLAPYLLGMSERELSPTHPLRGFQVTKTNREDTKKLITSINASIETGRLSDKGLEESFNVWWQVLEGKLAAIETMKAKARPRLTDSQMIEQILELTKDYLPRMRQDLLEYNSRQIQELAEQVNTLNEAINDTREDATSTRMALRVLAAQAGEPQARPVRARPAARPVSAPPPDGPHEDIRDDDIPF